MKRVRVPDELACHCRRAGAVPIRLPGMIGCGTCGGLMGPLEPTAAEERAAIVAWLKDHAKNYSFDVLYVLIDAACAIERGEHRKKATRKPATSSR